MYISKLAISNFRAFDSNGITVKFKKGVNAIISENNCGKTAIVDALRIAFSTTTYKKDIFFNLSDFHVNACGERSNKANIDVFLDEVPAALFEIWDPESRTKGEFHIQYYTTKTADKKEKIRYKIWGGPVEGNALSAETFDAIRLNYLGALRDAENELRPMRTGKVAALFSSIVDTDEAKQEILSKINDANSKIADLDAIGKLRNVINDNLSILEQELLRQKVGVGIVEPKFESIAASLKTWLVPRWIYLKNDNAILQQVKTLYTDEEWQMAHESDDNGSHIDAWTLESKTLTPEMQMALSVELGNRFEIAQNGLGYNNLLFMSTVLGDIENSNSDTLFNLLLVEEPEAHLHPQLQELIHSFFENNSAKDNVQVIYTSHSPTLVSRIGIDKIALLYENAHSIKSLSFSDSNLDEKDKSYLERYLDVTKSQMLFAKGIIFVEGISEALLLSCFAKLIKLPLDKYAVSVVNIDGVAFEPFVKLLCCLDNTAIQTIKAAVVTDDDRCTNKSISTSYISKEQSFRCTKEELNSLVEKLNGDNGSDRFAKLNSTCANTHIKVFGAKKTLEYELCQTEDNIKYFLSAIIDVLPQVGKELFNEVDTLTSLDAKATLIWVFSAEYGKYKAQISQALLRRLEEKTITEKVGNDYAEQITAATFSVPEYIKKALYFVTKGRKNV